ncbi:MAG: hypothetical protein NVS4B3_17460 [Gemmatimonadaceae bacterium]
MQTRLPIAAAALMLVAAPLHAQQGSPNTTPGALTRVVLFHVKPGHADQFWADVRQHGKAVNDELKRQGFMMNYSVGTKTTLNSPEDWNVVMTFTFPNWAAIDNIVSHIDAISLAHYGSAANRAAAENARLEHATVVSVFWVRDQTVNPWK